MTATDLLNITSDLYLSRRVIGAHNAFLAASELLDEMVFDYSDEELSQDHYHLGDLSAVYDDETECVEFECRGKTISFPSH